MHIQIQRVSYLYIQELNQLAILNLGKNFVKIRMNQLKWARIVAQNVSNQATEEKTDFTVGDVISYKGKEITVLSVERKYDSNNEFYQPKDGKEFVKINIKVENKSEEKYHIALTIGRSKIVMEIFRTLMQVYNLQ